MTYPDLSFTLCARVNPLPPCIGRGRMLLRNILRQGNARRFPASARLIAQGCPRSSFHSPALMSSSDECVGDYTHDTSLYVGHAEGLGAGSAAGMTWEERVPGGVSMVAPIARVEHILLGVHQAAGALLKQWAFALPPLAVLPSALLPGWPFGEQQGKAEEELEGYEEAEEGVEDVEFFSRWFDSVKRKRLAKMKRHKWKKRRREQRQAVKKDYK